MPVGHGTVENVRGRVIDLPCTLDPTRQRTRGSHCARRAALRSGKRESELRRARDDCKHPARRRSAQPRKAAVDEVREVCRDCGRGVRREHALADGLGVHSNERRIPADPGSPEGDRGDGKCSTDPLPLVPPEDAEVVVDLSGKAKPLEHPQKALG